MGIFSIILLAMGLSMDSFAISITNGFIIKDLNTKKILIISFSMAFFHMLMLLIGWFAGSSVEKYIKDYDHWIAFVLLSFIGIKMIYESFQEKKSKKDKNLKILVLLCQSVATSIDALAIGISFAFFYSSIIDSIFIIGGITLLFSIIGLKLGKYLGEKISKSAEIFGGIVLLGIGFKILIEHLFF